MSEITPKDISEYLDTQDDFDLELFVYRKLLEHGIASSHGGTYIDPHLGKARQFDIRASVGFTNVGWELNLAIECKSLSADFPLIVSRVPRPEFEATHYLVRSWVNGAILGIETFEATGDRLLLYGAGLPVGKHTFQLRRDPPKNSFKTGDSDSYDKWSQALASAADLVERACGAHGRYGTAQAFSLVLPVLVVSDDTLWVVDYDDRGQRSEPKLVEECQLFVDRPYELELIRTGRYIITHIHIFTRAGFVSFVRGIMAPGSLLLERMFGSTARVLRQQPT
jgi:hypothetical protein